MNPQNLTTNYLVATPQQMALFQQHPAMVYPHQQRSRNQQRYQNNVQQRNPQQHNFVPNQFMIPQQQIIMPQPYLPVFNTMPMQMPQQQMMVPQIHPIAGPRNLNAKAREFTPSESKSENNAKQEKEYKEQKGELDWTQSHTIRPFQHHFPSYPA